MANVRHDDVPPRFESEIFVSPLIEQQHYPAVAVALQAFFEQQCQEQLDGYIWYREPPSVSVQNRGDHSARLIVSMRHGGSVEDEWLALHLLLLATANKTFSEQTLLNSLQPEVDVAGKACSTGLGLIANVTDEDGQFLLIEAADTLPTWLQPTNAQGRVWLSGGQIHIIPPTLHSGDLEGEADDILDSVRGRSLHSSTAVNIVRQHSLTGGGEKNPLVSLSILQALISRRLTSYPHLSWAAEGQHSTLAYLPTVAAKVLHRYPQLIANASEAFEARDGPADARTLRSMAIFGAESSATDYVQSFLVHVKLPRRTYALLLAEKYFPPKPFGVQWRESVMRFWESVELSQGEKDAEGRRRDLGCKIACGLELLLAHTKERQRNKAASMFDAGDDAVRQLPSYTNFLQSLTAIGYFGQEVRDSFVWKQREQQALKLWRESMQSDAPPLQESASDRLAFLPAVVQSCSRDRSFPPHVDSTQEEKALLLLEDTDGFLYDDGSLANGIETKRGNNNDEDAEAERLATEQINAFSTKLQSFVDGQGDEVGALFDDDDIALQDEEDDEEAESEAQQRLSDMNEAERQTAYEKLIPRLAEEEWGAKTLNEKQYERQLASKEGVKEGETIVDEEIETEGVQSTVKPGVLSGFSRTVKYDGASDSDESVDDEVLRAGDTDADRMRRARALDVEALLREEEDRRRIGREDGDLDEGDWLDDEDDDGNGEGQDRGELGHDDLMGFIEFTRKELGLSEEQFSDILQQRKKRGAYVPDFNVKGKGPMSSFASQRDAKSRADTLRTSTVADDVSGDRKKTFRQTTHENERRSLRNTRTTEAEKFTARNRAEHAVRQAEEQASLLRRQEAKLQSRKEPDAFTRLMDAMDQELLKIKQQKGIDNDMTGKDKEKHNDNAADDEDDDMMDLDSLSAQDAELLEKMLHSGPPASLRALLQKEHDNPLGLSPIEAQVMDGMLQSYQAQMGNAGPAGNLAGRFGLQRLPRHSDA